MGINEGLLKKNNDRKYSSRVPLQLKQNLDKKRFLSEFHPQIEFDLVSQNSLDEHSYYDTSSDDDDSNSTKFLNFENPFSNCNNILDKHEIPQNQQFFDSLSSQNNESKYNSAFSITQRKSIASSLSSSESLSSNIQYSTLTDNNVKTYPNFIPDINCLISPFSEINCDYQSKNDNNISYPFEYDNYFKYDTNSLHNDKTIKESKDDKSSNVNTGIHKTQKIKNLIDEQFDSKPSVNLSNENSNFHKNESIQFTCSSMSSNIIKYKTEDQKLLETFEKAEDDNSILTSPFDSFSTNNFSQSQISNYLSRNQSKTQLTNLPIFDTKHLSSSFISSHRTKISKSFYQLTNSIDNSEAIQQKNENKHFIKNSNAKIPFIPPKHKIQEINALNSNNNKISREKINDSSLLLQNSINSKSQPQFNDESQTKTNINLKSKKYYSTKDLKSLNIQMHYKISKTLNEKLQIAQNQSKIPNPISLPIIKSTEKKDYGFKNINQYHSEIKFQNIKQSGYQNLNSLSSRTKLTDNISNKYNSKNIFDISLPQIKQNQILNKTSNTQKANYNQIQQQELKPVLKPPFDTNISREDNKFNFGTLLHKTNLVNNQYSTSKNGEKFKFQKFPPVLNMESTSKMNRISKTSNNKTNLISDSSLMVQNFASNKVLPNFVLPNKSQPQFSDFSRKIVNNINRDILANFSSLNINSTFKNDKYTEDKALPQEKKIIKQSQISFSPYLGFPKSNIPTWVPLNSKLLFNEKNTSFLEMPEFFYEFETLENIHERILGRGTYGFVLKVRYKDHSKRPTLDHFLAIKVINNQIFIERGLADQLKREIELHGRCNHPNILKCFKYFVTSTHSLLILEGMDNNLQHFVFKLSEARICDFVRQLLLAVNFLHENNIIHRDIKLDNILWKSNNTIKLADFGWCADASKKLPTNICGTFQFMAPEIINSEPQTTKIDIWSIGCCIYELFTGRSLFRIPENFNNEWKTKILQFHHNNNFFLEIDKILQSFKVSIDAIDFIKKLLAKQPSDRPDAKSALGHPWLKKCQLLSPATTATSLDSIESNILTFNS